MTNKNVIHCTTEYFNEYISELVFLRNKWLFFYQNKKTGHILQPITKHRKKQQQ